MRSLLPDVFRFVTIAGFAVLTGQVAAVVYFYVRANRLVRKVTDLTPPRPGLLPKYVALMTLSFWSLAAEVTWMSVQALGEEPSPWMVVHPIVVVLAATSLAMVMQFERRRVVAVEPVHAYHLPNATLIVDDPPIEKKKKKRWWRR